MLKITITGKTKICKGLFNISPEQYLPVNSQARPYLEGVPGIDPDLGVLWTKWLEAASTC